MLFRRTLLAGAAAGAVAAMLAGCEDPRAEIKELKSLVQVAYGNKKFREVATHASKGLTLALANLGPKSSDTLYFAQALSEAYTELRDKKNALAALNREIDLRLGAGQGEQKVQARRTLAIKFAEEIGDRAAAAKHAVAIAKAIGMEKGKDPQPVYRTDTVYPPEQYAKGVEGDVTISYALDRNGSVLDAKVVKAKPGAVFDAAALNSFKNWRFTPMLQDGVPVESSGHEFTLQFRLGQKN